MDAIPLYVIKHSSGVQFCGWKSGKVCGLGEREKDDVWVAMCTVAKAYSANKQMKDNVLASVYVVTKAICANPRGTRPKETRLSYAVYAHSSVHSQCLAAPTLGHTKHIPMTYLCKRFFRELSDTRQLFYVRLTNCSISFNVSVHKVDELKEFNSAITTTITNTQQQQQ